MNTATISSISIQLKLINEYDPIFMLLAIKSSLKLKVFTFSFEYQNVAMEILIQVWKYKS